MTLGVSQVRAIQHADGKYQTRHDKFLHELAQVCVSSQWLNATWVGWDKGTSTDNKDTTDAPYRKPVIHNNNARTQLKRQDPEYRAHKTTLQRKRRQEANASSK